MIKLMLIALVAVLPLVAAETAFAEAAISEPGLYSFYHPGGDVLGYGARAIRPGVAQLGTVPPNTVASVPPRATRHHRRAPR